MAIWSNDTLSYEGVYRAVQRNVLFYFLGGGGGVIPRVIRHNVQNLNISITALIPNIGQTVLLAYSGRADVALSEVSSRVPTYTLQ